LDLLRISVLGRRGAHSNDGGVVLTGAQVNQAFVYLVLQDGRPVPVDELAAAIWPAARPQHWQGALRGLVRKMRVFLEALGLPASALANRNGCYQLDAGSAVTFDLKEVRAHVADAERFLESGQAVRARSQVRAALHSLEAPLLPDVDAPWLVVERDGLDRLRTRALRAASRVETEQGQYDEAIELAHRAFAHDRCDEESCRTLMTACLAGGDPVGADAAYRACRRALAESLGLSPSAETEAVHLRVVTDPARKGSGLREHANPGDQLDPAPVRRHSGPFVGRTAAWTQLRMQWAAARSGSSRVVLLHGEAGIGKTRLALEALHLLGPDHALFGRAHADRDRVVPFEAFTEALRRHLLALDDDELHALADPFAAELCSLLPALVGRLGAEPLDVADATGRTRLLEAVRSIVEQIASESTVLVLDDLQHADTSTHLLLRHLVRRLDTARLLVIVTYRDDVAADPALAETLLELRRSDRCRSLRLDGLDEAEVAELVKANDVDWVSDRASELHRRTRGNCLYLCQVLAAAAESPDDLGPATMPETVQGMVRQRVHALSEPAQGLLEIASVVGSTVPSPVMELGSSLLSGELDPLDELVAHGLLHERGADYEFAHGIVRDAVYELLPDDRRQGLHRDAARALGDLARRTRTGADWASVAHQYLLADDPGCAQESLDATVRAARRAMETTGYEEAAVLYRRAVQLVDQHHLGPEATPALLLGLGAALRRAGDFAGARTALSDAVAIADRLGQHARYGEAVLELVAKGGRGVAVDLGDLERAELLEGAADRLGEDEPAIVVPLLAELALALMLWPEQAARRNEIAERARRTAHESGQIDLVVRAVVADRLLHTHPTDAAARLDATKGLLIGHAEVSLEERLRLHLWRLYDSYELGDRTAVDREQATITDVAAALGQPYWRWLVDMWGALHTFVGGDEQRADEQMAEALERVASLEHTETMLGFGVQHIGMRLHQGRGREIVDLMRDVVDGSPQIAAMRAGLVFALCQAGELDEARRRLPDLVDDDFAGITEDSNWSVTITSVGESLALLGETELAAALIPRIEPCREHFIVATGYGAGGVCWGPFSGLLGTLHACCGDAERAVTEYDHALATLTRFRAPLLFERIAGARARVVASTTAHEHDLGLHA
jgi:DNA-binding SARP family transcriptional activator/tetratricopeptide (TPR) repeat protein